MIVPLTGNVKFTITLDPSVWIFDDRKIILEEAFNDKKTVEEKDELKDAAKRWDETVYPSKIKPPVNKTLSKHERESIFEYSYVMPINDFVNHAEINEDAKDATLVTKEGHITISLDQLQQAYLLFSKNGKPLKEDGPVHLIFKDGLNKEEPIKGIEKIIIN